MILPVLDYCDVVWHECGEGNGDKINDYKVEEWGLSTSKLPQNYLNQIMSKLGLEPLYYRRWTHILRFVHDCISSRVPGYVFNYFKVKNLDFHETSNNDELILDKLNQECTKHGIFY